MIAVVALSVALALGDEFDDLKIELRDRNKWVRQDAVEGLAKLATPEAWELVFDALSEPLGEVADVAQFELGRTSDAESIERVLGKRGLRSKDLWMRLRCAEIPGRWQTPLDGEALAKALKDREPEVRRTLLFSLERLARAGRLVGDVAKDTRPAVLKLRERDKDARVRARALAALVALGGDDVDALLRAGELDDEPELRAMAALLVPGTVGAPGVSRLSRLLADEVRSVRWRAADALASLRTVAAVRALAARLADEQEARLGWRLVEHLQRLSGLKHRRDARPWIHWAERLPADWVPVDTEAATTAEDNGDRSIAFAGLPILSRRVSFLIDLSGSIWKERSDGRTRKEVVDERLSEVLASLPPETEFNVIVFTAEPIAWRDELVAATPTNVRKASAWFTGRKDQGTGNFWDAALLALEDPRVDTLVVLTDGAPTGGRRYHLALINALYAELDATRCVAVDSILVDASRRLQNYWAELAAVSGGRSIAVEL